MAKKTNRPTVKATRTEDKPTTLKDLLRPEVLGKLQAQAAEMKASELSKAEEIRKQAEETRKAEQKKLDNNFEHLLEQSALDWHKFK
ncbi:hypothetical protein J2Z69_003496 [Paenibacillus shirakamiensis]|uniref:DUF3886 domain-containing protein n=1 Tax=Paenibacillus shirakamiensis TaxID=1265935 RepID=A0ABS4JL43_9BACL|nr:hypothetical protein [Paenibacillus shirakamiensis]